MPSPKTPRSRSQTTPRARTDTLRDGVSSVADIPEIRVELIALITALLKDMKRTIMIGDPKAKEGLFKILVPELLKRSVTADSTDDDLRKEFEGLMAEIRGEVPESPNGD